ncbi:anhydro-N-acetylmuramic acid kinase [Litorilituus sediminis]|uniref:anhydro-N-acetylmuramic acid kinase n=1 Tax=Litorilituus sediminis TaxID=718192 RepID=UPI001FE5D607|nr:anhydro-N-acetylmuramic acid kinase [Litorilituus sediminis]
MKTNIEADISLLAGKYYIGLMSGTSADGVDLALVSFTQGKAKLVASYYQAYSPALNKKITALYCPNHNEIELAFSLDIELAYFFSQCVLAFIGQQKLSVDDIIAIGNHGQTIRHRPSQAYPFTVQIGCSQTLACLTNIRVIGQFRQKDIALGGQGAPLVPAFHQQVFKKNRRDVVVVNLGGIANISYLPIAESAHVIGFDTGPANALLDDWYQKNHPNSSKKYDSKGKWASSGTCNQALLTQFLQDEFFNKPAPKSTGREYFNIHWLLAHLTAFEQSYQQTLAAKDIQASLAALTAKSLAQAISSVSQNAEVYLCGGGAHNDNLAALIADDLQQTRASASFDVRLSSDVGVDIDAIEAMTFAWLAYAYDHQLVSNLPSVTGAQRGCTLGCLYTP